VYCISPLELACFKLPDSVHLLLEHGANVNEQNRDGRTALHWAVLAVCGARSLNDHKRAAEIIRQLLAYGANPNLPDKKGKTAVDSANMERLSGTPAPLAEGWSEEVTPI